MDVYYLAHPVSTLGNETVESNLAEAERWLVALQRANPRVAIIAPWIQEIRLGIGDENNPEHRRLGLQRDYAVAAMKGLTGIAITGKRIGSGSLGELRAMAEGCWSPVVHRFRGHDQNIVFPHPNDAMHCDFSSGTSLAPWLQRCRFGLAPNSSISLVGAEILAAIELHGVR